MLLPRLLDWMSYAPDPDGGLLAYRRLSESVGTQSWYLATLRDKPAVARRLMHVLGTSLYVPDLLMRAPEVIQTYSDGQSGPRLIEADPAQVARALIASATGERPGAGGRGRAYAAPSGTGPHRLGGPARHARGQRRAPPSPRSGSRSCRPR